MLADMECTYCLSREIVEHNEGFTCSACARVQNIPVFGDLGKSSPIRDPFECKHHLLPELESLVGRHILQEEEAIFSQKLYYDVRSFNVNYETLTLLALTSYQAMFSIRGRCLSLRQLGSLFYCPLAPSKMCKRLDYLRRKYFRLFPYFSSEKYEFIPAYVLNLSRGDEQEAFYLADTIRFQSGFNIERATCLFFVLEKSPFKTRYNFQIDVLKFVCGWPSPNKLKYLSRLELI
jgi:hypothetical protein